MKVEPLDGASLTETLKPLDDSPRDFDSLLQSIGDSPLVLIGEATHGTHEFYRTRAEITKRLIAEKGFSAVCVEGDWPDAYRVNRYVRGADDDPEAVDALGGFRRFPTWMWRNAEVLDFVSWLREFNDHCKSTARSNVGFYGLDLYSMYASIDAVIAYLDNVDPQAAQNARRRYACLERFERRPEQYAFAMQLHPSCQEGVLEQLREIQRRSSQYAKLDGRVAEDQYFYAEQNARVVAQAESYYRAMLDESISTWNLRDSHMVDTLDRLMLHLSAHQKITKAVVWAHNSHVGDATATSMSQRGETNVGALSRNRFGGRCFLIGFTTYSGTVTAASDWHAPEERKTVRQARPDSYEYAFHHTGTGNFYLPLREHRPSMAGVPSRARERAIGVIYRPETELQSHYFVARLIDQFDAVFHYDTSRAVEPLERSLLWLRGEVPETYPSGV